MFVAEYPVNQGTSLEELKHVLDRNVENLFIPLDKTQINSNGLIEIPSYDPFPMTETALHGLCSQIGVPTPYMKKSPNDVASENLNFWLKQTGKTAQIKIDNNVIIAVLPEKRVPLSNSKVVSEIAEKGTVGLTRYTFNERGLWLDYLTPDLALEPKVGDIIRVGVQVFNSDTTLNMLSVRGLLYRLWCLNGAVSEREGLGRFAQKIYWRNPESALREGIEVFDQICGKLAEYQPNFIRMQALEIDGNEERLRKILKYGKIPASYFEAVQEVLHKQNDESLYGFYNAITQLGRDAQDRSLAQKFEKYAGWIVANVDEFAAEVLGINKN